MVNLTVDQNFKDKFTDRITGDGSVNVEDGILITQATTGSAMKDYKMNIKPGQRVVIKVMGKATVGEGRVAVDILDGSTYKLLDYVSVFDKEWNFYELEIVIPFKKTYENTRIRVSFGKWTSMSSSTTEFSMPSIETSGSDGIDMPLAYGAIKMESGVPILASGFASYGIEGLEYQQASKRIRVNLANSFDGGMKPLLNVSGTHNFPQIPLGGGVEGGISPYFYIKYSNGVDFIEPSEGSYTMFRLFI